MWLGLRGSLRVWFRSIFLGFEWVSRGVVVVGRRVMGVRVVVVEVGG